MLILARFPGTADPAVAHQWLPGPGMPLEPPAGLTQRRCGVGRHPRARESADTRQPLAAAVLGLAGRPSGLRASLIRCQRVRGLFLRRRGGRRGADLRPEERAPKGVAPGPNSSSEIPWFTSPHPYVRHSDHGKRDRRPARLFAERRLTEFDDLSDAVLLLEELEPLAHIVFPGLCSGGPLSFPRQVLEDEAVPEEYVKVH